MTGRPLAAALMLAGALAATPAVGTEASTSLQVARQGEAPVEVEGAPLPLRASPGLEELARALAADRRAWAPLPGLGPPGSWFERSPEVWVVRDLSQVAGSDLPVRTERWAAGYADASRGLVAVLAGPEGPGRLDALRTTLRHELAHLALDEATGGRAPRWLQEGYAQLAAGDWDWEQAWRLRAVLLQEGGDLLHRLALDFPDRERPARTAYLLSYTAVQELARRGGERALSSFFGRLQEGATVDAAMRDVYGISLSQFEKQWRESVKGRYGWLYFFSRASIFWALLTLAVLALGWRRWRHEQKRWEELRRREERESWGQEGIWWVEEEPWKLEDDGRADRPPRDGPAR